MNSLTGLYILLLLKVKGTNSVMAPFYCPDRLASQRPDQTRQLLKVRYERKADLLRKMEESDEGILSHPIKSTGI